ncbi:YceI family protein [Flavobacterium gawalongense]|uniref:YceI family protein n=1 Tax=Flavobacterium gawalongense TaxID=2594432 RepID=A0ABY3CFE8_9FLAO|nr:YceI family protein [Flavobacterium gawalongense]TRW97972.1 YceI family protein [Flavobacterium gawalongense]TRX02334.1 YceI family protein [Flavobacterium gawalongense]TRX10954.1 YceI family protein [Flavobacterium gawalongense]TRX25132.1 YceI family protein [Flavobacterium gawalongense]
MKNLKSIALALVVVLSTLSVTAQTKKVDASKSIVNWVGKKVTGKHEGTVNLKDGKLIFKGKKLAGGTFNVDMTSLTATDLSGEYQGKLNGHLKSEDFFGTEKFPTATLIFKKVVAKTANVYTVTGDLTIKGKTNPITFDLATTKDTAATSLKIDRTKYDIKYGSGSFFDNLGDKAISDEFDLAVALKF